MSLVPLPESWSVTQAGAAIVLRADIGTIVVEHGLAPVARVEELFAEIALPSLVVEPATIVRLATCEHERAVLASARCGSEPVRLGFIAFDDGHTRIVGRATRDPKPLEDVIATMVRSTRGFLGPSRRRRFWYEPPPGWRSVGPRAIDDTWLAPGYPRERASISVPRALPVSARAYGSMITTLLGVPQHAAPPSTIVTTHRGLVGARWRRRIFAPDGVALEVTVASLSDGRHDYLARSIAPPEDHAAFTRLLESIEPLLAPPPSATEIAALSHWCA